MTLFDIGYNQVNHAYCMLTHSERMYDIYTPFCVRYKTWTQNKVTYLMLCILKTINDTLGMAEEAIVTSSLTLTMSVIHTVHTMTIQCILHWILGGSSLMMRPVYGYLSIYNRCQGKAHPAVQILYLMHFKVNHMSISLNNLQNYKCPFINI